MKSNLPRCIVTKIPSTSTKVILDGPGRPLMSLLLVNLTVICKRIINDSPNLSDAFNEHFSTIGPKLAAEIPLLNNQNNNDLDYLSAINKRFQFSAINSN